MTPDFSRKIPDFHVNLYEGKRGLIVGIANEHSIAWGCAAAFRGLGAELAVTYSNDKARKFVEPLANELEAKIVIPLDVTKPGEMEAVFDRIEGMADARFRGSLDRVLTQGNASGRSCTMSSPAVGSLSDHHFS